MKNSKKIKIKRLFIVALVLSMLLCLFLIACGEKDSGRGNTGDEDNSDDDIIQPWQSGFHIMSTIEEEYVDDDFSIDLLYGVNIDLYHASHRAGWSTYLSNFQIVGLYLYAYDCRIDRQIVFENLCNSKVENANRATCLIDKIPFDIEEQTDVWDENRTYQYISLEKLRGTEYECVTDEETNDITCYKKVNVNLPRELFAYDKGHIKFELSILIRDRNYEYVDCVELPFKRGVEFDYAIVEDRLMLSDISQGENLTDGSINPQKLLHGP